MKNKFVHLFFVNAAAFGIFVGGMTMANTAYADELSADMAVASSSESASESTSVLSSSETQVTEAPEANTASPEVQAAESSEKPKTETEALPPPSPSVTIPAPSGDGSTSSSSNDREKDVPKNTENVSSSSSNEEKNLPSDSSQSAVTPSTKPQTEAEKEAKDDKKKNNSSDLIQSHIIYKSDEEMQAENNGPDGTSSPIVRPGTGSRVVTRPTMVEDYRFWQIGKTKLFAKTNLKILEEKKDDAKVVGTAKRLDLMYRIKDAGDGWLYVESGNVRGFVKASQLYSGKRADRIAHRLEEIGGAETDEQRASFDWSERLAKQEVPITENKAYTWYRATTKQVVIKKKYAEPNDKVTDYLEIHEDKSADSECVGKIPKNGFMYIIGDQDNPWVYVESGDVRGFVDHSLINDDDSITKQIEAAGESSRDQTETIVKPEDNDAYYYTITSVASGIPDGQIGESLVSYASSFIGNPYVWGGTSLTQGADCSGFVQSIYAQYGISLPRIAADQAQVGTAIPVKDAMPGDLVFYQDDNGYIYHVMIYAGNGKTVEAFNSEKGIISGTDNQGKLADWAVRVLDQTKAPDIKSTDDAAEITPTQTCGGVYTYEKWNTNWASGTYQKALHDLYENYDDEGFGKIGDRYVVACTTTFGRVGDLIDFELSDGTVIKTVMGDAKNQSNTECNLYGHLNGHNVIEFIVNGDTWYGQKANPGTSTNHPEWGGLTVTKAINYGNILG